MRIPLYNPYAHLAHRWPHIQLNTHADLPRGLYGAWTPGAIHLSRRLTGAGRRCTLAHEIVHLERGPAPLHHPVFLHREEQAVDRIAAGRLIHLAHLADAIAWTDHLDEIAEACHVDRPTLRVRLRHLTTDEWRWLAGYAQHRESA